VAEKKASAHKPNIIQRIVQRIQRTIQETIGELRKVSWPTRDEAFNLTKIVIGVILGFGIFLGLLDLVYTQFFKLLLGS
jgi:preprotein translocase subunit SecE